MYMLITPRFHSRLFEATASSPTLSCTNSDVVDGRQPGFGRALAWESMR